MLLYQEILDIIFLYSDYNDIIKWKKVISNYVYNIKQYPSLDKACKDNNLIATKWFMKTQKDIEDALIISCKCGYLHIAFYILNTYNVDNSILTKCLKYGIFSDISLLHVLVKKGADIHASNEYPLRHCCSFGSLEKVKFFIDLGAKITDDCLINSAKNGHIDIVDFLIKKGIDIHIQDDSPLLWSCFYGHLEVSRLLIDNGANIFSQNNVCLINACCDGYLDIVKLLIEKGCDVHTRNEYPLICASIYGHLDLVKYLVEKGADIHINNEEPLRKGCHYLHMVKYFFSMGCNLHAENEWCLIINCIDGRKEVVEFLLDKGADIHTKDDLPLLISCMHGRLDIVKLLINRGVVLKNNLLEASINEGKTAMVRFLLRSGCFIENTDNLDLYKNCEYKNLWIVKLLIKNGIKITNDTIKEAKNQKNKKLLKLLLGNTRHSGDI